MSACSPVSRGTRFSDQLTLNLFLVPSCPWQMNTPFRVCGGNRSHQTLQDLPHFAVLKGQAERIQDAAREPGGEDLGPWTTVPSRIRFPPHPFYMTALAISWTPSDVARRSRTYLRSGATWETLAGDHPSPSPAPATRRRLAVRAGLVTA